MIRTLISKRRWKKHPMLYSLVFLYLWLEYIPHQLVLTPGVSFHHPQAVTGTWHLFHAIIFCARLCRNWIVHLYTLDVWKLVASHWCSTLISRYVILPACDQPPFQRSSIPKALPRSPSHAYGVVCVCCVVTWEAQVERTHPSLCTHQMRPHQLRAFEVGDLILGSFVPAQLHCTSVAFRVDSVVACLLSCFD